MATLYEIEQDYMEIVELLANEDSLRDEDREELKELINKALENKADGYIKLIRSLETNIEQRKDEIDRLNKKNKTDQCTIDRLRARFTEAMMLMGKKDVKTPLGKMLITPSYSVEIVDEDKLPDEFKEVEVKTVVKPKKIQIKKELRRGSAVVGAELITNYNLNIK